LYKILHLHLIAVAEALYRSDSAEVKRFREALNNVFKPEVFVACRAAKNQRLLIAHPNTNPTFEPGNLSIIINSCDLTAPQKQNLLAVLPYIFDEEKLKKEVDNYLPYIHA
jgi:hypothetical protein